MENLRVKWQYLLMTGILVALAGAAACIGDESSGLSPDTRSPAWPGQAMVAIGEVTGTGIRGGIIDTITFRAGLVPGEKPIPLENLSIIYADAIRVETLRPMDGIRGDPPQGSWGVIAVENEEGAPNTRLEYDEEVVLRLNPLAPLVPRQFIMIVVQPPSGPPLTLRRASPPTILEGPVVLAEL